METKILLSKLMLTLLGLVFSTSGFAQKFGDPKNISEAIVLMDKYIPRDLKENIRDVNDLDSIKVAITFFFAESYPVKFWSNAGEKGALVKFYHSLGISNTRNIEDIVLRTYQNHLRKSPLRHEEIYRPIALEEFRENQQEKIRFVTDTLDHTYIPKDLEDCFRQIDKFWNDSIKTEIKQSDEGKFGSITHHGFGTWVRNNWGLWSGSRLTKYFNEMGIHHPDDMSGIILTSYYRFLKGQEIRLSEQVRYYIDYWEAAKKKSGK